MKRLLLVLVTTTLLGQAFSQDKIYKKGGEVLEVKVTEIGTDELKYKLFGESEGPTYSLEKDRILRVVYENGRTENYVSNLKDPELYADQTKRAMKINFLSPLLGYTQLNFEQNIRPGRGYELSAGFIGLGKRQELSSIYNANTNSREQRYREALGLFVGGGYKFSKTPDFVSRGSRYSHVLQGTYVKPEVLFGIYGQNRVIRNPDWATSRIERTTNVFGGLMMNLGKQWVLGDIFLVDLYGGLGYALDNRDRSSFREGDNLYSDEYVGNHFALITGAESGLGFTGGFRVGLLLNKRK